MRLSVLVPCYNEKEYVLSLLELVGRALPAVHKEIVLVDDGSRDGSREILEAKLGPAQREDQLANGVESLQHRELAPNTTIALIFHTANKGKGGALQTAMRYCSGDVTVVQDADLEYDPADWALMWNLIAERRVADVVYGSRFYGRPHRSLNYHHFLANRLISFLFNIFYNQTLTDIETCYKMFTREVRESLRITQNDFGFEVQISAQIARAKTWRIYELGISYFGRTYDAGKKINWKDGVKALWYILKFRFSD